MSLTIYDERKMPSRSLQWPRPRTAACVVTLAIVMVIGSTMAADSHPWPMQLAGIESVNLYIHLPGDIDESVSRELRSRLRRILIEADVSVDTPSAQSLALDVDAIACDCCSDHIVARLVLRLREPVQLLRDPTIKDFDNPPVVWSIEHLLASPTADLPSKVVKQAERMTSEFAGWVRTTRKRGLEGALLPAN